MHTKTNINHAAACLALGVGATAQRLKTADRQDASGMSASWLLQGGHADGWRVTLECVKTPTAMRDIWAAAVEITSDNHVTVSRVALVGDGGTDGKVACMRARAAFYRWAKGEGLQGSAVSESAAATM